MTIEEDIDDLKSICDELKENYSDDEWDLCEHDQEELYRITGIEEHDWDDENLAHYIDGMQRALWLIEHYA